MSRCSVRRISCKIAIDLPRALSESPSESPLESPSQSPSQSSSQSSHQQPPEQACDADAGACASRRRRVELFQFCLGVSFCLETDAGKEYAPE